MGSDAYETLQRHPDNTSSNRLRNMTAEHRNEAPSLAHLLKQLIQEHDFHTQTALVHSLKQLGYDTNQSKISRLLRTLQVIKVKNQQGEMIYHLPKEPLPPSTNTALAQLVMEISTNETLIVIRTSPGSASLIARLLDHHPQDSEILGTLAGDDTVFVTPRSMQKLEKTLEQVNQLLNHTHSIASMAE